MTAQPKSHVGALIDAGLRNAPDVHTQQELALRCEVSRGYINRLLSGRHNASRAVVHRIAEALGQDPEDYELAILKDRGEAPRWTRSLAADMGVQPTAEDERAIAKYAEEWFKHRHGS